MTLLISLFGLLGCDNIEADDWSNDLTSESPFKICADGDAISDLRPFASTNVETRDAISDFRPFASIRDEFLEELRDVFRVEDAFGVEATGGIDSLDVLRLAFSRQSSSSGSAKSQGSVFMAEFLTLFVDLLLLVCPELASSAIDLISESATLNDFLDEFRLFECRLFVKLFDFGGLVGEAALDRLFESLDLDLVGDEDVSVGSTRSLTISEFRLPRVIDFRLDASDFLLKLGVLKDGTIVDRLSLCTGGSKLNELLLMSR